MTKRDSSAANLASPRFLHMDSWSTPLATTRRQPSPGASSSSGFATSLPGPSAEPIWLRQPWVRIHGPNGIRSNTCEWRLLDFFLSTKPILTTYFQPRQRVVHTQLFKLIEVGEGPHRRSELWISEADWQGCERLRHPEHFFHGIVGHVKDKWGHSIYGWREASRLAKYWRRYFQVEEGPYNYHQAEPHEEQEDIFIPANPADDEMADDDANDTSTMGIPPETADQVLSVPLQISQMARIRYDVLIRDPEFNAPILELIQTPPQNPMESNVRPSPARTWPSSAATWRSPQTSWPGALARRNSLMMMKTRASRDNIGSFPL